MLTFLFVLTLFQYCFAPRRVAMIEMKTSISQYCRKQIHIGVNLSASLFRPLAPPGAVTHLTCQGPAQMGPEVKTVYEESASGIIVNIRLSRKCLFVLSWFLRHIHVTFAPIKRSGTPPCYQDSAGVHRLLWRLAFVSHRHTNLLPFSTLNKSSGMCQGLIDAGCLFLLPQTDEIWRRMKMRLV